MPATAERLSSQAVFSYSAIIDAKTRTALSFNPESHFPRVGERFLGFHLIAELGAGTFGRVYLARQPAIGDRLVALKVASDIGGECLALSQLRHTNIVPIYSVHEDAAHPMWKALCMPYLGGTTLQSILGELRSSGLPQHGSAMAASWRKLKTTVRNHVEETLVTPAFRGAPPSTLEARPVKKARLARALTTFERIETESFVDAVLEVAAALADGLAHAHAQGILHRDLKPANVIVTDDGEPMLVDFNLSEDVKKRSETLWSMAGGTLPYMAPEQIDEYLRRPADVDQRSDLYSLGVILFELLTGKLPFPCASTGTNLWEDARMGREGTAPSARGLNRAVSRRADVVITRCLEADPERRYQSARELHEDLQCCLKGRPLVHARDPFLHERVGQWAERRAPRLLAGGLTIFAVFCAFSAHTLREFDARRDATTAWATAKPALDQERFEFAEAVIDRLGFERVKQKALDSLRPFDDGDRMDSNPRFRSLADEDRLELQQRADEFAILAAGSTLVDAAGRGVHERDRLLAEGANWIRRVERFAAGGDGSKTVALLRACHADLAGAPEAVESERRADALEPRDALDAQHAALVYAMQRRFNEAAGLLEAHRDNLPDSLFASYLEGFCRRERGEVADAIRAWEYCAQVRPTVVRFRRLIGLTESRFLRLLDNNQYAPLRQLDAAVAFGADTECLLTRAYIYKTAGRYSDAIQDVRDVARLGFSQYYAWSALRRLASEIKDPSPNEQATIEEATKKVAELKPQTFEDWYELARYGKDAAEALSASEKALALRPWSIDANAAHLERLLAAGTTDERVAAAVERAHRAAPDLWKMRLLCGRLLALQGNEDAAFAEADQILSQSSFRSQRLAAAAAIYAQIVRRRPEAMERVVARIVEDMGREEISASAWRMMVSKRLKEIAPDLAAGGEFAMLEKALPAGAATN